MNELSTLCEKTGADIESVRQGLASDPRIGGAYLFSGIGYGGGCLPKDVRSLIKIGSFYDCRMIITRAINKINRQQRNRFVRKILDFFSGRERQTTLAVWGLAFKTGTDDLRESPAIYCIKRLLIKGFKIRAYDPIAGERAKNRFKGKVTIVNDKYDVLNGTDGLVIFTEGLEFKNANLNLIKQKLKQKVIFDSRNLFQPKVLQKLGINYYCLGRNIESNVT